MKRIIGIAVTAFLFLGVLVPVYFVTLLILGMIVPISLPTSPEIFEKEPNVAYSLKSTTNDMAMFAQELLRVYDENGATALNEFFISQVKIDEKNSWGAVRTVLVSKYCKRSCGFARLLSPRF